MSQTNYNEQGDALVGMVADSSTSVVDSFSGEVAIPFGRFVIRGTNRNQQCKLPAAAGDINNKNGVGVAIRNQAIEIPLNSTAAPTYKINDSVPVLSFGRAWVETESAGTDTTKDVYVRHTAAGANTKLGAFSDAAGTGLAKLDNAKWRSEDKTINSRRMAIVEIRL